MARSGEALATNVATRTGLRNRTSGFHRFFLFWLRSIVKNRLNRKMKTHFLTPSIAQPSHQSPVADTPANGNARASNPSVSESPATFSSRSRPYGCAAFLQSMPFAQAFLLNHAKSSAEKNPNGFCHQFDASNLTEESCIELARLLAEKAPQDLAENIQKFEISDEKIRIEIAYIIAEKKLDDLIENIQKFGISDENTKLVFVHTGVKKALLTLAENIQHFGISDASIRINIARRIAEKEPYTFARNIQNFAITDESDRIEFANGIAAKGPSALAGHIRDFKISGERIRVEIARRVAEKEAFALAKHIQKFELPERDRIELAHSIVKKEPDLVAENIQNFGISDESSRIAIARSIAEKRPHVLARHIQNFEISDKDARIEFARKTAEKYPMEFLQQIRNFEISDASIRIELIKSTAEKCPVNRIKYISREEIPDERIRTELARVLVEKEPSSLAERIRHFKISDEDTRIKLARIVAEKEPSSLALNIERFNISNESVRTEFARIVAEKNPVVLAGKISEFKLSDQSILASLYATCRLQLIRRGLMEAGDRNDPWINLFFPRHLEPMQLAAQFGSSHPVIGGLVKTAEQQPDPHIRKILSPWTHLVALRFAAAPLPEAAWQALQAPLEAIQKWRAPAMRYDLFHLLAQHCLPPANAETVNAFLAFGKQFTRPHTRLYPVLLFPLFQSAPDDPALRRIVTLLHQSDFKDVKRQTAMVNSLLTLVQAKRLSTNLKRSLLQAALPSGSSKEAARSLAKTAPIIECLVWLANENTASGKRALRRLESIRSPGDFNEQMNEAFKELFQLRNLPDTQNVEAQFNRYQEHSRYPTGLIEYAVKINRLAGHEKTPVLAAISQFVNATVLSRNPEQALKQLRYDPAKSDHLRILANKAPAAFAQWQQPCLYQPSAAFLANAADSVKRIDIAAYLHQRIVADRHVPAGTYPLLEQVLNGQKELAAALQESERQAANATASGKVETGLLQLLDKQTPVEQKTGSIAQLLAALPQGQLHHDLTALKTLLMPSIRQDAHQFTVVDTDAAEDLFLCGTEVVGSCQKIQGEPFLNKALMGYVLDGKYRMLAIKAADGRLMGRRMLRLLWDESKQCPVLHLERLYHNPGIPEKYERALVELALQKAKQMNCALVSHDGTLKSSGIYRAPLKAHPTCWPFEYVDAQSYGVQNGREGYQLSMARIVASPD